MIDSDRHINTLYGKGLLPGHVISCTDLCLLIGMRQRNVCCRIDKILHGQR